jgi:hypothetical protein
VSTRSDTDVEVGGLVAVRLHCELDGRTAEVSVERSGGMTVTSIATDDGLRAGGTMATHVPGLFALVGRELQEAGEDRIYTEALHQAAQLAGR